MPMVFAVPVHTGLCPPQIWSGVHSYKNELPRLTVPWRFKNADTASITGNSLQAVREALDYCGCIERPVIGRDNILGTFVNRLRPLGGASTGVFIAVSVETLKAKVNFKLSEIELRSITGILADERCDPHLKDFFSPKAPHADQLRALGLIA